LAENKQKYNPLEFNSMVENIVERIMVSRLVVSLKYEVHRLDEIRSVLCADSSRAVSHWISFESSGNWWEKLAIMVPGDNLSVPSGVLSGNIPQGIPKYPLKPALFTC